MKMYIPSTNKQSNEGLLISFMKENNFAILISFQNVIHATHLPFVVKAATVEKSSSISENNKSKIKLLGHFAKANPHWKQFAKNPDDPNQMEQRKVIVIFSGPHGYISPSFYDDQENVPTWNYATVHCSWYLNLLESDASALEVLEELITVSEPNYLQQWKKLPENYKKMMLDNIVAFEVIVTEVQGKYKLSQNRSMLERERIANAFCNSKDDGEIVKLGKMMAFENERSRL